MAKRLDKMPPDPEVVEDIDNDPDEDAHETTAEEILEQANARLKLCQQVWQEQRDREKSDLQFQLPDNQWDDTARRARKGDGQTAGRPTLSVSLLDQPINLITNQMRSSDLGIQIHPVSPDANRDTAETIQGIYRFIESEPGADAAREWAYDRAVKAGMGFYRVLTEYDDEGGDPTDQKIVLRRILYQDGVFLDPAAQEPDFRDGKYGFLLAWVPYEDFVRLYPESKLAKGGESALRQYYESTPDWVRLKEGKKSDILVGEYYWKRPKVEKFKAGDQERTKETWTLWHVCLTGDEVLDEPYKCPGKWIPIIPVLGRELQNWDEQRRWLGMIHPAKDSQRAFNYAISTALEKAALEPKAPWVGPAASFEGYEAYWDTANSKNWSRLPYNMGSPANPNPAPARTQIDTQGTSLNLELAQMARDNVQAATAVFDPSLGKVPQKDRSGRAIMALQEQAESGTSHFLQSFAKYTLVYEALVILDLMPAIYNRPERNVRIVMGDSKEIEARMINAPSVMDQNTGVPTPAPPNAPNAKTYMITRGKYGVRVTIGKSYQTRMQEGAEKIGEFITAQPQFGLAFMDIYLRYQDFPGSQEMADRIAKLREQQMPGLSDGKDGKPTIEQLQGALMKGQQQTQMMAQQMQAMQHALETEQAKQQAQMAKAQLDAEIKMQELQAEMARALREDETKRVIAAADNETKLLIADLANQMKVMLETLGLQKEAMIAERQAENDERDRAHQVGMAAMGAETAREDAEEGRKHEAAMSVLGTPAPKREA